ncbi:hypothetical protein F4823DRAFT_589307 [Ustulina deusta]|nr:hypothetical protein F4823DRAFT_589307 [Ustulina deusta]
MSTQTIGTWDHLKMLVFLAALFYIAVQLLIFLLGMVLRMIRFIFKLVIAIIVAFLVL